MDRPGNLTKLKSVIYRITDVPVAEWDYFADRLHQQFYERGEILLRSGEEVREFHFIINGLLRYYYVTEEGKEFNKSFARENDFAGSISGLIPGSLSRYSIEAIEDTDTVVIPVKLIIEGYDRHPSWDRLGRCLAENVAYKKELREAEFLLDSAETRYLRFIEEYRDIAARLHQYHIASYLGITEVSLSRIRAKLSD